MALQRCGVRVAELPSLPAEPPAAIAAHPELAAARKRLGRKLSIELVYGTALKRGFRVLAGLQLEDGRRPDREAIEEARQQTRPGAQHADWALVLSVLADAQETGTLDDVALWEVVEVLRDLARHGYSQRALTEQAVRLSLERDEAEVLAAAVAEEHQMRTPAEPGAAPETEPPAPAAYRPTVPDPGCAPPPPRAEPPAAAELLRPVTDLQVRTIRNRTDIVQLSWSPPPAGVLRLRMAAGRPEWKVGTVVAAHEAESYGRPLDAAGVPGPDRRMTLQVELPQQTTFVTAMTVRDAGAVVGQTVEITKGAPVRDLTAKRFGPEVRLTWKWPSEDAVAAHVAWQPSGLVDGRRVGPADRQRRTCTRRQHDDEGGFSAVMGYEAQRIEVWAVIADDDGEQVTAPAEKEVPAIGVPVSYDARRVAGFDGLLCLIRRQRRRQIRVLTTAPCTLPDLIVVESHRTSQPLAPHDGVTRHKIPGQSMEAGASLEVVVELAPNGPSWLACFVDPAQPAAARGRVTLAPAPGARLRVR